MGYIGTLPTRDDKGHVTRTERAGNKERVVTRRRSDGTIVTATRWKEQRTYAAMMPPEMLTPTEVAANSHLSSVKAHYQHLNDELKDNVVRDCYLCQTIHPFCDECKGSEEGTWPQLKKAGWAFDVDGRDLCGICTEAL